MADAPATAPNPTLAGIDRLRDTAKWLIGAYAAVGAILVAGLQLTSLGKVEDDTRLAIAILGAVGALVAVACGIAAVARVLAPVSITDDEALGPNSDLETRTQKDPLLLKSKATDLQALRTEYRTAQQTFQAARKAAQEDHGDTAKADAATVARAEMMALFDPLDGLRKQALFDEVQRRFRLARALLLLSSVFVVAGVIVFAVAANPSDADQDNAKLAEQGPELVQPSKVTVWVDQKRDSLRPLRDALGKSCDTTRVAALAIGGSAAHPDVVSLPQDGCAAVRFTVTSAIGIGLAPDHVQPDAILPTKSTTKAAAGP